MAAATQNDMPQETQKKSIAERGRLWLKPYFDATSVHGLERITQDKINGFERFYWLVAFISSVAVPSYFLAKIGNNSIDSPVLMTIENNRYPIFNVAFPAVTVCNVNKVSQQLLEEAVTNNSTYDEVDIEWVQETLRSMTKLDDVIYEKSDKWNEKIRKYDSLNITPTNFLDLLEETSIPCDKFIIHCTWLGKSINCSQEFSIVPTDDGYCCTFNAVRKEDNDERFAELHNVTGHGYHMGLSVFLFADLDDYAVTNGNFDGFRVLIHDPNEFPDVADRGFVIGPGTETFTAVKIATTVITDNLQSKIAKEKRQCLVEGEHDLQHFHRYTYSGCMIECLEDRMASECKCRPYFLESNQTPICTNWTSLGCLSEVTGDVRSCPRDSCPHCLPLCADVWYQPEVSYAPFPGRGFKLSGVYNTLLDNLKDRGTSIEDLDYVDTLSYLKENTAVLHVYIAEATGVRYKRDIRFDSWDIMYGQFGLFGVGVGVSVHFFFELGYFFIFLPISFTWDYFKPKKQQGDAVVVSQ